MPQQFRSTSVVAVVLVVLLATACSRPFSGTDETVDGTPAATSSATSTVSRPEMMPIVTPTSVPPGATVVAPEAPGVETENPETYVVAEGDSLYAIALRFGVEIGSIIELNGLSDPNDIRAGQEIRIPPRQ